MLVSISTRTPFSSRIPFFVDAALAATEAQWRLLMELAWKGKGLTLDLSRVPAWIIPKMTEWHQELVSEENRDRPQK